MAGRRAIYLTVLLGCGIFYIAYGQWLSFLILVCAAALPWLSLLLSLGAMVTFRVSPTGPDALEMGEGGELWLLGSCTYPMPPFRGRLLLRHCFTGRSLRYREGLEALSSHCGGYTVTAERVRICDYLGLFSFPVWKKDSKIIRIRPRPVAVPVTGELHRHMARRWKPKSGGGYAENHELRLYRPGDNLNQVHWKLSAKTGQLILREPMEPQKETRLLTMNLRGRPEELDRKLGRLLWLGNYLLEQEIPFEIRVLTGSGILHFSAAQPRDLETAVDTLLCQPVAAEGDIRQMEYAACWRFHIGGEPDEA